MRGSGLCPAEEVGGSTQERAGGEEVQKRDHAAFVTLPALQPLETSKEKSQTQTKFVGTAELVNVVAAQITSGNPFTPAIQPLLGRLRC